MTIKWVGANSANYQVGRAGNSVKKIVCHWIVGKLSAADVEFQKPYNPVTKKGGNSSHYGVGNTAIHQYVKEENVAYHAGVYTMNQRSIGIEHEGGPELPISEATYQTSGKLIGEIALRYNIPLDREHIIKHSQVKPTQCPGTLDLDKLISLAKGYMPELKPDEIIVKKARYDELLVAESLLGEFRSNGYGSAIEVKQMEQDKNKAISDLRTELEAEKSRGEGARKEYLELLALVAEELGTQQEPNQIKVELGKISEKLDELEDLHRNYAALQLDSGKREEELRAEIKVLQERIKQVMADKMPLSKYELKELLIEISRRLLKIIKLSK
jgi:N-acetyl-anhydromuramyl-L-alanine amidase AmpD